jgi:Amt family ammonium transporter
MAENVSFPVTLTNPAWLDKGDNAWQLTAASLVALQSVPGLVVLYAGWVKHKWAINSAFMAFYAFGAVLICWVLWAYKESFGNQMLPFVGRHHKPSSSCRAPRLTECRRSWYCC